MLSLAACARSRFVWCWVWLPAPEHGLCDAEFGCLRQSTVCVMLSLAACTRARFVWCWVWLPAPEHGLCDAAVFAPWDCTAHKPTNNDNKTTICRQNRKTASEASQPRKHRPWFSHWPPHTYWPFSRWTDRSVFFLQVIVASSLDECFTVKVTVALLIATCTLLLYGKALALPYNNNNVHLSCAHQRPERSHDTY